ncbi:MAG: circadian clock KaiB family protein [Gammaproteobacteria bacterium]
MATTGLAHLFIAGRTPRNERLEASLRALFETVPLGLRLTVHDTLCDPAAAIEHDVVMTPTLLLDLPDRDRIRLFGNLRDTEALRLLIEVKPRPGG